ncbi:hypothetical protein LWI29_025007 [Acer saccharum]|uniref:non-specific serine/threonine protein kinase n=1 Tax=Acer saccharum TaxID=4024 RepID=A0AA39W322_ACESA|nr:hypothetical protein LWI29_025007 [Acer saccharum]KAK1562384.1 hypothetical protein Q3G72_011038 [Acer saccharum]
MNLSYNNLSGSIPLELGNLNILEFLQLNNNHLSGEIPSTFENLSSLLGCNFSYNDLSGPLPPIPLFQNMAISSFIGNNGLSGGPLGNCDENPSFGSIPPLKCVTTSLGRIITTVAAAVGGVSLILIIIILYLIIRPFKMVMSLQDNEISSPDLYVYFLPNEGFTFKDLVETTNNFHESYVIGSGASGMVYKAIMDSRLTAAIKKLASNMEGNTIENSFQAEILTLGNIRHHNIVKLYGSCYYQGSNLLIYEYLERGSLGEFLHGSSCNLEWPTWFHVAIGATEGLAYLHHDCKPRIIHCDIKSNNILLYKKFEAHVSSFGLAKVIEMPQSKSLSTVVGSTTCNHILNAS